MKTAFILIIVAVSITVSCDVQSGMSKKGVEKFIDTPTPSVSPKPSEAPIDPADIVAVDTALHGPLLSVNTKSDRKNLVCDKYNRVMLNGGEKVVTIKGVCSQIMMNGNNNDVTAEAVMEIVFNGSGNNLRYSRYGNGKRPVVTDNSGGNVAEKVPAPAKK